MQHLFEELAGHVEPFMRKYTRWNVPDHDKDDIRQELLIVLHRVQQNYQLERGAFLGLLKRSIINRLGQLNQKGSKSLPISHMNCQGCGAITAPKVRGGECSDCGHTRWTAVRAPGMLRSMNSQQYGEDGDPGFDVMDVSMDTEGAALTLLGVD